ncbi:alpha/beta fold hydrolase [Niallia sp. Krafla_26]|uniref:alpha/beta fold hydrolase n=1 Tax=Niallia sp. Krafla_26 TaxID=3064703 RepID=UPI003D16FDD8
MPFLDLDSIRLFYKDNGEGPTVVFIHPPLLTSANFDYQVDELSRHFRVITFDIRGHGRSPYSTEPITYSIIVEDIKNLLDSLEIDKAFLCGYSTGGSIVFEFLQSYADRALGGIVISGMSEVSDWYLEKRISMASLLSKPRMIGLLGLAISWGNSNTKENFRHMYRESLKGDSRNIKQYYSYSLRYRCTHQLDRIHHPILLIYGKKDKTFHKYAKILHEKLPYNQLKFIDEKHQIPTKSATELNSLISEFILAFRGRKGDENLFEI